MAVGESKRREIRLAELERAIADVCRAAGLEPGLLTDAQRYGITVALIEYAEQTRKRWETRERDLRVAEIMEEVEGDDRVKKLRRLIAHPGTPEPEREAAREVLRRTTSSD